MITEPTLRRLRQALKDFKTAIATTTDAEARADFEALAAAAETIMAAAENGDIASAK